VLLLAPKTLPMGHPEKPGTFDCKKSNDVTFEANLLE
jgi:hypothetical protein